MTRMTKTTAAVVTLAALAVPAAAGAHPSVFATTAKVVVPNTNPIQMTDQTQYVVVNHGFTYVLRETNGATTGGLLNFKVLPGAYRATIPKSQWFAEAGTGAQPHATCSASALTDQATVLSWQEADPFYDYIPFQAASAGLDDDPASWLGIVEQKTGVDLRTAADPRAACEALPGGAYRPADAVQTTAAALSSGTIAAAKAPLESRIAELEAARTQTPAGAAVAPAQAAAAQAHERLVKVLASGPLGLRHDPGSRLLGDGLAVQGTGPVLTPVTVRVLLAKKTARALKLRSRVISSLRTTTGADGGLATVLKPSPAAAPKLRAHRRDVDVLVELSSGARSYSVATTLKR